MTPKQIAQRLNETIAPNALLKLAGETEMYFEVYDLDTIEHLIETIGITKSQRLFSRYTHTSVTIFPQKYEKYDGYLMHFRLK